MMKPTRKQFLILCALATPLFAIVNPLAFFIGYINCFEETETPFIYVPNFRVYFAIAFLVYTAITVAKYPLFVAKRRFAEKKEAGISLYFLFHSAAQIPYLVLLGVLINFWKPRDLNELSVGFFSWFFVVSIAAFIAAVFIFNFLTYRYPPEMANIEGGLENETE